MRVSILTVGTRGDVQPFAAFGIGLQRAGHEVRICTHPEFRELVTGHGLDFAPLAAGALSRGTETEEGRRWAERQSRWMPTWVGLMRDARSVAHERMRDAAAGCRDADVIVATNLTQVLGWQLARERGVPLVRALLNAPAYWMSRRTNRPAAAAVRQGAWLAARPWLNRVRREALGLGPLPLARADRPARPRAPARALPVQPVGVPEAGRLGRLDRGDRLLVPRRPRRPRAARGPARVRRGGPAAGVHGVRHPARSRPRRDHAGDGRGAARRRPPRRAAAQAGGAGGRGAGRRRLRPRARPARLAVPALRRGGAPRGGGHDRRPSCGAGCRPWRFPTTPTSSRGHGGWPSCGSARPRSRAGSSRASGSSRP